MVGMPGINVLSFSVPPQRDFFLRNLAMASSSPEKIVHHYYYSEKNAGSTNCLSFNLLLLESFSDTAGPLLDESLLLLQLNISVKFFDAAIRWLAATASK